VLVGAAVGLGAIYVPGAWPAFWYVPSPGAAVAFFAPAGLTLATLAVTPRRTWPLWLAAFVAAEFGVDVLHHQSVPWALGNGIAEAAEPLVGILLLHAAARRCSSNRARLVGYVGSAVVAGPLVGAILGVATAALFAPHGPRWWTMVPTWWLGDALGVLVVGTLILAWSRPSRRDRASVQLIAAMAAAASAAIVVTAAVWHAPAILAAMPVLVWAAFVGGFRAVTSVGAAVAAATDWAAVSGRTGGLLAAGSPQQHLTFLQVFLALTLLTVMVLSVEIDERRREADAARRSELERARSEEAAVRMAEAERHSISQDTHDIVGHGLTAMLLHLGAAEQVLDRDPARARQLLASAGSIGRGACQDLDLALATLGQEATLVPGRGLAQVPELVESLAQGGLQVTLDLAAFEDGLPRLVDWSAYRIVREALTNVVRHAPGAAATVRVHACDHQLVVSVVDDGGPGGSTPSCKEGRGIIGMRERARALGGTLDAWPSMGGFAVIARLPF
jgi:signal transduction histidine kinase